MKKIISSIIILTLVFSMAFPCFSYVSKPQVPTQLSYSATTNSITVTWKAVSGATSYTIILGTNTKNVTGTSCTFNGLALAQKYSVQVKANNSEGSSDYSTVMYARTDYGNDFSSAFAVGISTEMPFLCTGKIDFTGDKDFFTFTAPCAGTYYFYSKGTTKMEGVLYDSMQTLLKYSNACAEDENNFAIAYDLSAGQKYYLAVAYENNTGVGDYSLMLEAPSKYLSPPVVTGITTVSAISNVTSTAVTVNWNMTKCAASYDVMVGSNIQRVSETSAVFTGLAPGTYECKVRANNSAGSGPYCSTKSIKTYLLEPAIPANVTASAIERTVTISWDPVISAITYDVMLGNEINTTYQTAIIINGVIPGTYTYKVRANNASASSPYSSAKSITVKYPLSTPANVAAVATADSITVSWDAVPRATLYDVSLGSETKTVMGTTCTFKYLRSGAKYSYQVRARSNNGDCSDYTKAQSIVTSPLNDSHGWDFNSAFAVTVTNTTTASIAAKIDFAGDIDYFKFTAPTTGDYQIEASKIISDIELFDSNQSAKNQSYLTKGNVYYIKVYNDYFNQTGDYTLRITAPAVDLLPPTNITGLKATSTTGGALTLSWNPAAQANSYHIRVYSSSGDEKYADTKDNEITFTGLVTGREYACYINAINNAGSSDDEKVQTILGTNLIDEGSSFDDASEAPVSPGAILAIPGYRVTRSDVDFFRFVAPTTGDYEFGTSNDLSVYLYDNSKNELANYFHNSLSNNSYIKIGLVAGETYYFKVYSGSKTLGSYTIDFKAPPVPSVPSNIKAISSENTIRLSWNKADHATYYMVRVETQEFRVEGTSIEFYYLTPGKLYFYQLKGVNEYGEGDYSEVKSISTLLPSPVPSATATDTTATVTWTPVDGATSYTVKFDSTIVSSTQAGCTFTGLTPFTKYSYQVKAENGVTSSNYCPEETIRTKDKHGDNFASAYSLTAIPGTTVSCDGNIDFFDDYDYFVFIAPTDGTYSINATGAGVGVGLYNGDRSSIQDEVFYNGENKAITSELSAGMSYYIRVFLNNRGETAYTLNIVVPALP